jgi:Zn-dependent peptidase ImmA (M78 family)
MFRSQYYGVMKALAAEKRTAYNVVTQDIGLQFVRQIYKAEEITVDLWDLPARIRGAYMCEDGDPSVLINRNLPKEPRLFAMVHELKHHYCDRAAIAKGQLKCGDYNANEAIEIGAEIFSAEFIFPEAEFLQAAESNGIVAGKCTAEDVVRLKQSCGAPVSYKFLQKRLEWFEIIEPKQFGKVRFQKLEEQLCGIPIYKQDWFKRRRALKRPL